MNVPLGRGKKRAPHAFPPSPRCKAYAGGIGGLGGWVKREKGGGGIASYPAFGLKDEGGEKPPYRTDGGLRSQCFASASRLLLTRRVWTGEG